jgi:hypothetical protein
MSRRIIDEVFNSEEVRRRMEEEMWRRRERRANIIVRAWIGIAIFLVLLENTSFWAWFSINNLTMDYVLAGLFGSSIIASLIFTNLDLEDSDTARHWASRNLRDTLEAFLGVLFVFTFIYLIASIAVFAWAAYLQSGLSQPFSPGSMTVTTYPTNVTIYSLGRNTTVQAFYLARLDIVIHPPTIATLIIKNVTLYNPMDPVHCVLYHANYGITKLPATVKIYNVEPGTSLGQAPTISLYFVCNSLPTNAIIITNHGNFTYALTPS